VAARSEEDALRFIELGTPRDRVRVCGDLKLDAGGGRRSGLAPELARLLSERPVFVAGSTHPGEEEAVLEALGQCRQRGVAVTGVIAPRRIERADEVATAIHSAGWRVRRRSALLGETQPLADDEVLLVDSLGELAGLYDCATLAFVGGTLADLGGHNLYEPVFEGAPVLFGPSLANVESAARKLTEVGAGQCVQSPAVLAKTLGDWLDAPEATRNRGRAGREALLAEAGSARRSLHFLREAIRGGAKP